MRRGLTRRELLGAAAVCLGRGLAGQPRGPTDAKYQLATFTAEVTPPLGHPLMGGGILAAKEIVDPLYAIGFVLLGAGKPIALVSVDWCEIRNDAFERWRSVLAEAAKTDSERVMVSCIHQHDAPIADLEAERILKKHKSAGSICDFAFHEKAVQAVARSLRKGLESPRRFTDLGTGQAKVEKVASNRRYPGRDGRPEFGRTSATRDPYAREQPEGTIDPYLKTVSFWDGDEPVLALSCYATHPMSYYGKGGVSSDFIGLARNRRQVDDPKVMQMYVSGCSGNITAGKYNDGHPGNRPVLAERIYQGMRGAWKATKRQPIRQLEFRVGKLRLEPRTSPGFTIAELTKRLTTDPKPFGQCLAALGLSWRKVAEAGQKIDVPVLDFGKAQFVVMPGESYVEYQLLAQQLRPDSFVVVAGYGECATGYVPIERAFAENDANLRDWCWVAPGCEKAMTAALKDALRRTD